MPRNACSFIQNGVLNPSSNQFIDDAFSWVNNIAGTQCAWDGFSEQKYNEYLSDLNRNVNLGEDPYFSGSVSFTVSAVPTRPYVTSWDLLVGTWFQLVTGSSNYVIENVTPGTYTIPDLVDKKEFFNQWGLEFAFVPHGGGITYPTNGDADFGPEHYGWLANYIGEVLMSLTLSYQVDDGTPDSITITPANQTICVDASTELVVNTTYNNSALHIASVTGGTCDWDPVNPTTLDYTAPSTPGTYYVTVTVLAEGSNAVLDSATASITVIDCGGGDPAVPPDPTACFADSASVNVSGISETYWPAATDTLRLEYRYGTDPWQTAESGVEVGESVIFAIASMAELEVRWIAVNENGETEGSASQVTAFCCSDVLSVPETPDPPEPVKDCETSSIGITPPTFPGNVVSMVLERSEDNGTTWTELHTFTTAETYHDTQIVPYTVYLYRWKACNGSGCSEFSIASDAVEYVSTTSYGFWLSPGNGSTVTGKVKIRFRAIDAGGIEDLKLYLGGHLLSGVRRLSGSVYNGVYGAVADSRRQGQGLAVLRAEWTGSDGCPYEIEEEITLDNSMTRSTMYRDFKLDNAPTGYEYGTVRAEVWSGTLNPSPLQRYVGQIGYSSTTLAVVDENTTPETAQSVFDDLQLIPLVRDRVWASNGSRDYGEIVKTRANVSLDERSASATLRLRCEPLVSVQGYETGSTSVKKIRKYDDGQYFVFCDTPAQVYTYDGALLELVVNLSTAYSFTSVTDVVVSGTTLYITNDGRLYAYDMDSDEEVADRLSAAGPFSMTHAIKAELIGTRVYILDQDTSSRLCWVEGNQSGVAWTSALTFDLMWSDGTNLYLSSGAKLYKCLSGSGEPVLTNSVDFADDITSIGPYAVGLANGEIWVYEGTAWSKLCTDDQAGPIEAVSSWKGALENTHYIYGSNTAFIYEIDLSGAADAGLEMPTLSEGTLEAVTISAMCQYETSESDQMLVGTGDDGLFYVVEKSSLSTADGAFIFSVIEDVVLVGFIRETPNE